jgi:hypothetical protein
MQVFTIIVNKVWEKRGKIKRCARVVKIGSRPLISGNDLPARLEIERRARTRLGSERQKPAPIDTERAVLATGLVADDAGAV